MPYQKEEMYVPELQRALDYAARHVGQVLYRVEARRLVQAWAQATNLVLVDKSVPGVIFDYIGITNEARVYYMAKTTASNGGTLIVKVNERPVWKIPMDLLNYYEDKKIDLERVITQLPGARITIEVEGGTSATITFEFGCLRFFVPT